MKRILSWTVVGCMLVGVWVAAQGPLTPLMNLKGRTDANGALMTVGFGVSGAQTPLTPLSNLRGRTDANGDLYVTMPTVTVDGIGTTTTSAITLRNTTAAAAGAQQYSPGLGFIGQGWKTNATAASQPVETRWELRPIQGAAAPTYSYVLLGRINDGAWTDLLSVSSVGALDVTSTISTSASVIAAAASSIYWSGRTVLTAPANGVFTVNNNAETYGVRFQLATVPAIASGFGTTPAITAGSTDSAGDIDVGTGGTASSGVINFATTWASAPFCLVQDSDTAILQRATTTTTAMTITSASAWTASDNLRWLCVGRIS